MAATRNVVSNGTCPRKRLRFILMCSVWDLGLRYVCGAWWQSRGDSAWSRQAAGLVNLPISCDLGVSVLDMTVSLSGRSLSPSVALCLRLQTDLPPQHFCDSASLGYALTLLARETILMEGHRGMNSGCVVALPARDCATDCNDSQQIWQVVCPWPVGLVALYGPV